MGMYGDIWETWRTKWKVLCRVGVKGLPQSFKVSKLGCVPRLPHTPQRRNVA